MTNSTTDETTKPATDETTARGPERFAAAAPEPDRPSWAQAAGAGLALLGLLVGIPVLLALLTGAPPIPTGLPDHAALTQPLSIDALFVVLRAVIWLAWLQFAVCTVVETVSMVRGGGLPRPVPLSGRSQAVARALVGTLLVGASFIGSTAAAGAATPAEAPSSTAAASSVAQPGAHDQRADLTKQADQADGRGASQHDAPRMAHVPGVPSTMTDVIGHKVNVVKPPEGHYHDNLWDIAERHLGDGRRWKEIYELNRGRLQPDGGELVIGRLIQPGWVLIMPDDATGVPTVHAAPEHAPAHDRDQRGSQADGAQAPSDADQVAPGQGGAVQVADHSGVLLGGGLLAVGVLSLLAAERRRRRSTDPSGDALDTEVALRAGADPDRAAWLDRALRSLAAQCRTERIALPQVFAATVTDDVVELRLAPAAPQAPAPWSTLEGGRRWRLERTADLVGTSGHAPYPALVCLGRDDSGADLLIDVESVGGPLAVHGDPVVAREVVSALAVQLATSPWSDAQQVWGLGLSDALGSVAGDRLELVDDLDGLLGAWAERSPTRPAGDVLTGRLGRHPGQAPQYLVLGQDPGSAHLDRLHPLTRGDARGLGVVAALPIPGARWQAEVDQTGRLRLALLDLEVDAVRLTETTVADLAALLEAARTEQAPLGASRVAVPRPPHDTDDAHWRSAPVRVGILGDLEVTAAGRIDPARLALATEIVAFLAVQPGPVHPSVVGASIWPLGVTPDVRDATIERTREWLGEDADGSHLLRETSDGRLALAPDVAVDWWSLCSLARRAREATGSAELELLRRSLRLVRGELLADRPARRYSWLPRTRLERESVDVVVDTGLRLAELTTDDDPDGAAAGCRAALALAPTSQDLWRALLAAEHRRPDGPGTAAVVDEMVRVLHGADVALAPETEALVVELLPDHEAGQAG
ncbi:LysM peptidoglycan-binding domain-containing protein [Nocardioides acrostichi]|uniref:LysM peptidoglycan-binding domain-containing protein n=1 Tax=Nocardioides acrostichi TaxID=2784339 RepID=A0A930V126_9ACTN|nr:LysM peptidoglycan-binding domain-containing protein [Nocardioides acrostichi]MBF4161777.1 LysM peptidoglycan-binding domain-containing protein [Nocardioides acrostichi]